MVHREGAWYTLICHYCGGGFTARRKHAKTCSDNCRRRLWREQQQRKGSHHGSQPGN